MAGSSPRVTPPPLTASVGAAATQALIEVADERDAAQGEVAAADPPVVLDPGVLGSSLGAPAGYGDLFVVSWFVASVATLGGALGTGLESDEAIRAAAYSKREEDRRARLAAESENPAAPRPS